MPADYPFTQLMADIMAVITQNSPQIVSIALLLGVVNFIIGWFMYSVNSLTRESFGGRR